MARKRKKSEQGLDFWKFMVIVMLVLNVVNFYFISGVYNILNAEEFNVPLSNTAIGNFTGYLVFGYSPSVALAFLLAVLLIYIAYKNWNRIIARFKK